MSKPKFRGWPAEAFDFYEHLEAENTRSWWAENKHVFEDAVRAPMQAFSAEVAEVFGPLHIFRPHRDVRFSKDKTPYKTHIGGVTEGEGGEFYYVQLSRTGLYAASGYYQMAKDQLARFRAAVDDDRTGPELEEILAGFSRSYEIGGEALKVAPRGYPWDHPRVQLLRHKGVYVGRTWSPAGWMATRRALTNVTNAWRAAAPVHAWLNTNVGPSEEAPEESWR